MDRTLLDNEVLTNAKLTAYGEILALGRRLKRESRVEMLRLRRVRGRSGSLRVHDMRMLGSMNFSNEYSPAAAA